MDRMNLLILDDEPVVRQSFCDYFEDREWGVIEAGSAEQALEVLEGDKPQAAIVDIRLPGMDGNEFVRELQRRGISLPVVICTGSPGYATPEEFALNPLVAPRVFNKPVDSMQGLESALLQLMASVDGQS